MSNSVQPHRQQPTRLPHPWDYPGKNTRVGCHFLLQCMKVRSESEVAQSCPTLSDPMDCSLPGSSIHGIFQARVLEWGAIAFSDSVIIWPSNCMPRYMPKRSENTCPHKNLCIIAHRTLLKVVWQPGCEGSLGKMNTCICMAESPCCPPETITTLLISYTPI